MSVKQVHPQAYDALAEALATFQWYKPDFARMLNTVFASDRSLLTGLDLRHASKRDNASAIVSRLQQDERNYQSLTISALMTLSDYDSAFRHLARLDDADSKVDAAQAALAEVKRIVAMHKALLDDEEARLASEAAAVAESRERWAFASGVEALKQKFYALSATSNPNQRGLAFEDFLNGLFVFCDLDPRGPFALAGEQIDGAFTFDTDDYLLEARWRSEQASPDQLRAFQTKVSEKTHRTSGLFLSINGFSKAAVELVNRSGSRLLLMDGSDLMVVLEGALRMDEVLLRKRRHAAETGDPYFRAADML